MKHKSSFSESKQSVNFLFCAIVFLIIILVKDNKNVLPQAQDEVNSTTVTTTTTRPTGTDNGNTALLKNYYMLNNYMPNKAATINRLLQSAGENAEAFVFITDPHTEQNRNAEQTSSLVNFLCSRVDLSRAIVGGDMFIGPSDTYARTMKEAFTDGTVHYVMGNHEYDRNTTDEELVNIYHDDKPQEIGNIDRHYYYVDSTENKLRYVVLNGWEEGSETADDLPTTQNEWLKNEALNVDEGWGVLVFTHQFINRDWRGDYPYHRYFGTAWKPIAKTLLEYDGKGEILAVFHGHIHQDMISRMHLDSDGNPVLDDTCGGIPLIGTASDKFYTDKENSPYEFLIDREEGTITEQAFDVVVVDRENGKIHCVRIGAPARADTGWIDQEQVEIRTVNIRE